MSTPHYLIALLRAPASCRTALLPPSRPITLTRTYTLLAPQQHRALSLPTILRPSFWASMVPRLQTPGPSPELPKANKWEWNPMTPYIVLGLLVGSQAIQVMWLKQDRAHSMRKAEAKIGMLHEVIGRVQRGEDVDVEGVLGTGDAVSEGEWKEVLQDMKDEEVLFQSKKKRKAMRLAAAEEAAVEKREEMESERSEGDGVAKAVVESVNGVKFY